MLLEQTKTDDKFKKKIKVAGSGYICTICSFSTGFLSEARAHAKRDGMIKKRKSKAKSKKQCVLCEEVFGTQSKLDQHFRTAHQNSSYLFSVCSKTYTVWKTYTLRLKSHNEEHREAAKNCRKFIKINKMSVQNVLL